MINVTSSPYNKGFQLTFANGWTVSVQIATGNYCDNRSYAHVGEQPSECANAEIAAWDANGKWYSFGNDNVAGWKTPDEVSAFIAQVAAFPISRKDVSEREAIKNHFNSIVAQAAEKGCLCCSKEEK